MNIAIMGACLSGLSCAITLERNDITPTIFEKRSIVGDRFVNAEALFSILNRPIKDSLSFLSDNYHIHLTPVDECEKFFIHSRNEIGSIDGKIGYTNIRGRHENSFENQLMKQVKSNVIYNSTYKYEDLCKDFEYVVLATGDGEYASQLGNYNCNLTCTIKGATVTGEFFTNSPHVWFNYDIIPKGYGWLIPFSSKEANLVMAYPDYPNNIKLDINSMWDNYYNLVSSSLDQNFKVTDSFEITKYMIGICNKPKIEGTYFVGNCFGSISPGLGFGQLAAILTGVYAAYDMCSLGKYEELVEPLYGNYNNSFALRKFLEKLRDEDFDFHVRNLNNGLIHKLADKFCSSDDSLDFLKLLSPGMKLFNSIRDFEN